MFRIEGTVVVKRKAGDVGTFLADVANEPSWQKEIVHVALVGGEAGRVGARYERVQVVAGRNIKTLNELVEMVPGKRVVFEARGKVIQYRLTYTLSPNDSGTKLHMGVEGEMLGFASMFEGMAADELRARAPADLERLRSNLST